MHELAIAEGIVDTVLERTGGLHVELVRVRVGKLTAVVPDALLFSFELAAVGTPLERARLEIDESEARGRCRVCDAEFVVADLILLCGCGSADVEVLAGHELLVSSVEVV